MTKKQSQKLLEIRENQNLLNKSVEFIFQQIKNTLNQADELDANIFLSGDELEKRINTYSSNMLVYLRKMQIEKEQINKLEAEYNKLKLEIYAVKK